MTTKKYTFARGALTSTVTVCIILNVLATVHSDDGFCPLTPVEGDGQAISEGCGSKVSLTPDYTRYILYSVNNPEGFNLRRDVYIRMAIFVKNLNKKGGNWKLVLPPWIHLYHWQSAVVKKQNRLPWHLFFDVESLNKYVPVIEFYELIDELSYRGGNLIDHVCVLQHFADTFSENKLWEDKWAIEPCLRESPYVKTDDNKFTGPFWSYRNITADKVDCVSFQGPASQLTEILKSTDAQTVMFDHAEVVLHDHYGQAEYWKARRSMRFSTHLVDIAREFRASHLNSTDENDGTVLPIDWTEEKPLSNVKGGPYLAVHLRRNDFLWGRKDEVPTLEQAALQIKDLLKQLNLTKVYIATDAPNNEFVELFTMLDDFEVFHYHPSVQVRNEIKDGGVAIVDQIICSHAAYFYWNS